MQINHVNLHVDIKGSGIPFIWGHGLTHNLHTLQQIIYMEELSQTATVIRYDARGHGQSDSSPNPADYTWSNLARDMVSIADSLEIDRFVAGGASMGCATSLFAAIQHPERISGLVLALPPTAWENRASQAEQYEKMAQFAEKNGTAALVKAMRSLPQHWATQSAFHEFEDSLMQMEPSLPTVLRGAKISNMPDEETIRSIQVPTLILAWTEDLTHPLYTAETLHRLIHGSELHIAANLEEVSNWTARIRHFLEQLSS
ncbi:MAG: alpha/beta fold hydrolase [Clostridia bacterium]